MTTRSQVGDQLLGQIISAIFGQSEVAIVYTTDDNHLRWDYQNGARVPPSLTPAISTFDGLMTEIKTIVPPNNRPAFYAQLGKALFNAFETGTPEGIAGAFSGIKKTVATCAMHSARFRYVISFLAAAAILSGACLSAAPLFPPLSISKTLLSAATSGVAGAAMSVLYRSSNLALDPTVHRGFLILQGIARAILGGLFGVFVVLACKGEVVLAFAKDHPLALYPIAVVAGFSERYVPEIMSHLEGTP